MTTRFSHVAGDADDADDSSYPIGKLSERQIIKWAGNKPRIARITRTAFADDGSSWGFPIAGNASRDLPLEPAGHA